MIEIDGSFGEGGGQILRTALGLSAYTKKGFKINNIRANRSNPGLSHQHLKCVETIEKLMDADVEGKELRSTELVFRPNKLTKSDLVVDIGTAGSVSLLLQCLFPLIPELDEVVEVKVVGGTDVKWSPPVDYLSNVVLFFLEKIGLDCSFELKRRGYYPRGGGEVIFKAYPSSVDEFSFIKRGRLEEINGVSYSSNLPKHVAKRQKDAAKKGLKKRIDAPVNIEIKRDGSALGKGSGVVLWSNHRFCRVGGSALGEKGKPAEEVGEEAANEFIQEIKKHGCLDKYLSDQLVPFLGLATNSKYSTTEITSHTLTNKWVVERFLDIDIEIKGEEGEEGYITS